MYYIHETLNASETIETFLQRWFTQKPYLVQFVTIVRHLQDVPREDVAYVLRKRRNGENEVLIVFLKDYDVHRIECHGYREQEMPGAFDCPRSILEQLPPSTDQVVLAWRKQCWQRIHTPLRTGDTITFDVNTPLVPAGVPVEMIWESSSPVFINSTGQRFHVPLWKMYPYSLLSAMSMQTEGR